MILMLWKNLAALSMVSASLFAGDVSPEVPLWPSGAPGSEGLTAREVIVNRGKDGALDRSVSSVHNPTLTVYLPDREKANGSAFIVCPGGGHRYLTIDKEGIEIAKWLNGIGVAGFVLKYRLAKEEGSPYKVDVHALQDGLRAVRLVRSRAEEWGIDPKRVGMVGFSAGGELTALVGTRHDQGNEAAADPIERQSSRPDFLVLVYPGFNPENLIVNKDTPPSFLVHADDDRLSSERSAAFYVALKKAGVSGELHIYAHGGHGFGMRNKDVPVSTWPARLQEWMSDMKLLRKP
jgi:endo-1,4-beta-xylanase